MNATLDAALNFLLHDEGGWVQRKNGAMGNMGIGMATLISWRAKQGKPRPSTDELKNLSVDEAKEIYTKLYAEPINFDALPAGLDYAALDCACNEGVGAANRLLAKTASIEDVAARIQAMSDIRIAAKQKRPEWAQFGPGWTKRISEWVPARTAEMMKGAA